jgi:hypothetical protein
MNPRREKDAVMIPLGFVWMGRADAWRSLETRFGYCGNVYWGLSGIYLQR